MALLSPILLLLALLPCLSPSVHAQPANPVYMDDSPAASETFLRVRDHLAADNLDEAARVLQVLLDTTADRVVESPNDPDLFVGVRSQVHRALLATPALLKRYRELQEPVARELLAAGRDDEAERTSLLTQSGYEAALRVSQRRLESAQFEAARMTLVQLLAHPDHSGERARQAGALMSTVARYLDRDDARAAAAALAGMPLVPQAPVAWAPLAKSTGVSPMDPAPRLDLNAMLGKPLRSVPVGSEVAGRPLDESGAGTTADDRLPVLARELRIMPTAAGDTLYLNDGATITAWDRISLTRRWQAVPPALPDVPLSDEEQQRLGMRRQFPGGGGGGGGFGLEEASTVTVRGRWAIATTGDPFGGGRERDPRVHAVDALTGELRWSVDVARLSPELTGVSVRGPAVISEGVVVVGARRNMPERRLLSLHLAGLDLATGKLLWGHMVGSAGSLPWSTRSVHVTDACLLHNGVVYRADMLGVIGAFEAVTGRPVWVRRIPPQPTQLPEASSPWQMHTPILHEREGGLVGGRVGGDSLIMLSPDRQRVVRLDAATGEILAACGSDRFSTPPPQYLVRTGDQLVAVCDDRIAVVGLDDFETAPVRTSEPIPDTGIRGRVIVSGSRLMVPVASGIRVIDAAAPDEPGEALDLDSPGNVLALESQLVVVDDAFIHSYLQWEVAEKVLSQRMIDDPSDPAPAVTLTELAYRAGQEDRILAAVDAALAAIGPAPFDFSRESSRKRLFESLHTMLAASQEPAGALGPADDAPSTLRLTDAALLGALVERLGRAASTLDEQVSFLLTLGRLQERRALPDLACDSYQKILEDPQLARATWAGPRLSVRGELEATRRLERLVAQHGPQLYAAHERRAQETLAAMRAPAAAAPDSRTLIALATRFPLAAVAPELWSLAADAMVAGVGGAEGGGAGGAGQSVVGALESGLEAAERSPDSPWAPILAGRLITELEGRGQIAAAGDVLRRFRLRNPCVALVVDAQPIDADTLAARLGERLAERHRWARIGDARTDGVQTLLGWMLMEPVIVEPAGAAPSALIMRSDREVAIWGPGDQPGAGEGGPVAPGDAVSAGELTPIWRRTIEPDMVDLVRVFDDSALLFFPSRRGSALELVGLNPPDTRWRTDLFATPVADPDRRRILPQPAQPQVVNDATRTLSDLMVTMDDRTIVAIERTGHATALDAASGEVLWHAFAPLDRVADADLSSGTLVVGGEQAVFGPGVGGAPAVGGAVVSWRPEIVVLDARTGSEQQRLPQSKGRVRWLRLVGPTTLIAGLETAVVSLDLATAQPNWIISDYRLASNRDAWVFDDRLYLLDKERHLWLASVSDGRMRPEPLEAPRSRLGGVREIRAFALDDATTAFCTYQGVLLYAPDGALKGIDAIGGFDAVLPAVPSEDRLLTISAMPENRRADGELIYSMHFLDTSSAMLMETVPIILGAPPRTIALLDNRIAITAGGTTVILYAPAE